MKRITRILVVGNDVHIVSCGEGVKCDDPRYIVDGLQKGHVKLVGSGIVSFDGKGVRHFKEIKDAKGAPMVSPNRAKILTLIDISERKAFANLIDIAPDALKTQVTPTEKTVRWHGGEWPVSRTSSGVEFILPTVACKNCGNIITGRARVNGDRTQVFVPDSKDVSNRAHDWYCGCTTYPVIPEHPKKKVSIYKEIADELDKLRKEFQANYDKPTGGATVTVTFTGSVAGVDAAIQEYAKGRK